MYIYAANGRVIGEITHSDETKETIVMGFTHAFTDALGSQLAERLRMHNDISIFNLVNIVNIPQNCPHYQDRLNFAEDHIKSVYKLCLALARSEAQLQYERANA